MLHTFCAPHANRLCALAAQSSPTRLIHYTSIVSKRAYVGGGVKSAGRIRAVSRLLGELGRGLLYGMARRSRRSSLWDTDMEELTAQGMFREESMDQPGRNGRWNKGKQGEQ